MLRQRRISCDQLRGCDEIKSSRGQHGHVQRLADVASGFGTIPMLVEQATAHREIQQNGARQHRHRSVHPFSSEDPSEDSLTPLHDPPW